MVDRSSVVLARGLTLFLALTFVVAAGGCGSSSDQFVPGTASCTITQMLNTGGMTVAQQICEEGTGLSAAQVQQLMQQCMVPGSGLGGVDAGLSQHATFAAAPCPRAGALGGCRVVQNGMTIVAWYYQMPGFTSAEIQQLCSFAGLEFVPP